ncbi:ABC transporter permease [Stomatohabitans albus]|uniref:ABC transporter permease n=1 Tax=Stomatohabitans albus TaxID=3110766 RepID=UPI00300D2719
MDIFSEAFQWLGQASSWVGPSGIGMRIIQHLGVSLLAVVVALLLIGPLGMWLGHRRSPGKLIWTFTAAARSVPTLALLTLVALMLGIGLKAPLIALIVLAIPSILAATYSGIWAVDDQVIDAMRGSGMNERQILMLVEIPLALPVILGGIRNAMLQVFSTATLAAYTADIGLGRYIFAGLKAKDYPLMLGGAILVTVLTLTIDIGFEFLQQRSITRAVPTD